MDNIKRRTVLKGISVSSIVAVSGCTTESESGSIERETTTKERDQTTETLTETTEGPAQTEEQAESPQVGSATGSWPTFQYSAARTGYTPNETGPTNENGADIVWTYGTNQTYPDSSPVVAGEQVFVTEYGGSIRALDLATGREQWKYSTNHDVYATPTVRNGVVYIGSVDENFYALESGSGELLWQYNAGFPVNQNAAVDDGIVYLATNRGPNSAFVTALEDGKTVWSHDLTQYNDHGAGLGANATVSDGDLFIGTQGIASTFVCLNTTNGEENWTFSSESYDIDNDASFYTATVSDGLVYVPLSGARTDYAVLLAFNRDTGSLEWEWKTDNLTIYKVCAVGSDAVYVILLGQLRDNSPGKLMKLNKNTGAEIWSIELETSSLRCTPVITKTGIYLGNTRIDPDEGKVIEVVGSSANWSQSCVTNELLIQHGGGGYQAIRNSSVSN